MKITATRELRYGGRDLRAGDTFEASPKDAKILKAIRKAKDADAGAEIPAPPRARNPRVARGRGGEMQFQSAPVAGDAAGDRSADSDDGRYNRRDMRAED